MTSGSSLMIKITNINHSLTRVGVVSCIIRKSSFIIINRVLLIFLAIHTLCFFSDLHYFSKKDMKFTN